MSYAIETVNICKNFNQVKGYKDLILHPFRKKEIIALKDINIQVNKGELFGLLGPNGAGKTTLIKILSGLILPTKGKAYIAGYDVARDGKKARGVIGYVVSEERSFYWRLTGRQNLRFFATLNNLSQSQAEKRIDELIALTGLDNDADRMFKDYSKGMKQRLAIARGLITSPEVLLMDEPTKSLDPSAAQHLKKFIKEKIVGEDRKTVFLATHNLSEAEELCHRIAIINHGKIKACGTLMEIRSLLNTGKRYFVELKDISEDLVNKLYELPSVDKIVCNHSGFSSNNNIEMEITINGNGDISAVIEQIIHSGGKLLSCYPHQTSLGEIFSKVVEEEK
ncbi:MAG: ABC transporter ATP-binding protein [Thermodesulfovibrionales bacterium]|nr:ABC transporter ATP-binding protein [Thermodesulfovibrionales bacterium]